MITLSLFGLAVAINGTYNDNAHSLAVGQGMLTFGCLIEVARWFL